jgi:hypothetical protein
VLRRQHTAWRAPYSYVGARRFATRDLKIRATDVCIRQIDGLRGS